MKFHSLHFERAMSAALFVLLLSVVGMKNAYAHDFEAVCPSGQTLYYNIINATNHYVEVTYLGDSYYNWYSYPTPTGDLIIPNSVSNNGITYSVTSIGNHALFYCQYLTSVTIPNSVTSIENSAFYHCVGLSSVTIPNSVTMIGTIAFYDCSGLNGNLTIPNSVTIIDNGAFSNCSGLTGTLTIPMSVTSIGTNPFSGCSGLEQIVVAPGNPVYDSRDNCNAIIKTSTNELISGCKNSIIPNSITSIGENAFRGCNGLVGTLNIPSSIISIKKGAFGNCSGLTGTLTIPASLTSIGTNPFSGCSGLEQIVVESGNMVYDSRNNCNAIIKTSTNTLVSGFKNSLIPNSVTSIGESAFAYCNNLTSITIPNSVTIIGFQAFEYCNDLTSIIISDAVTTIGGFAFNNCHNLTSITIPNSVTSIEQFAFQSCNGLTSVTIGNSTTYIGSYAFHNCSHLSTMTILAETPPTLSYTPFSTVPKYIPVYVPVGTIEAYQNASGWNEFTNYHEIEDPMPPTDYISDGLIMYLDGINNTRNGHSTTTDVWEDLIGNYDLTVSNYSSYIWEDNHFIGLGNGGYLNTGKTWQYFNSLNDDITIEIVTYIDCDKTSPAYRGLAGWHEWSDGTNFQNDQGSGRMQTLGQLPVAEADNTISTVSYTRFNGSFLNGTWKTNNSNIPSGVNSNKIVVFGNSIPYSRGWNDSIYCIRMYNRSLTPEEIAYNHIVDRERFVVDPNNASYITALCSPVAGGTVSGAGVYENGQICTLNATPNNGYFFLNWTKNDQVVSSNSTYSFTVTENATYTAHFTLGLPELHVTSLNHSTLIGGQQATISWTVKNDGSAATPNGAIWHDRVWLSLENKVDVYDNNPILLGAFENLSALNVGEYYTQTQTVNIPLEISGDYYLFVTTDAYDAYQINWDNNVVPNPYNPPPYISCLSHGDNVVYEQSECEQGYAPGSEYNDNFFYTLVDIAVPLVPDLQVTSVIPPNNFYSGTNINVTATISNLGEITTLSSSWVDALYVGSEPDISSATCIATKTHNGALPVGSSYQVHLSGRVPITMYGEAYFFVYTDCYEQVYEHILNQNNITMSNQVNIILSPPADLETRNVVAPSLVSTGESFAYSYQVFNVGAGSPNVKNWEDKVYLSQDADTIGEDAILLKTHPYHGNLPPTLHYSVNESLTLPSNVFSGIYYLYVVADANDEVFEYLYESNNMAHSSQIIITTPDLQVAQVTLPEQITSGYPLNLSYTLSNTGMGAIVNQTITDKIFISASGSMADAIMIDSIRRNVSLPVGQSMTVMRNETVPAGLVDGTFHLLIVTDFDNEINESNEGNNTYSHYPMAVFHQPLPDLQPVSLTIPSVIQAGEAIPVEFDIINNGDLDLLNSNCTFNIYAAWDDKEILCPMQSQTLPLGSNVSIGIGQTVHFVRSILVPPTVTSACSTFELIANKGGLMPELDTTNNIFTATASVLDCPLPDLVVTNISANTMQSGVENQISFTVKNIGTTNFEGGFNTTVYVRSVTDTIYCPLTLQVNPTANNYSIPVGGTLAFTQKVLVPPMANASCNLLEVIVDEENLVLESNDDNNATTVVASITNYPFDLKTTTLQVPESVWAGEITSLTWTVKNIGTCPSEAIPFYLMVDSTYFLVQGEILPQPWMDKVYVSEDAVLSDNDIELCSVARSTVLQPNGTYAVEQSVTVPYTHLGNQYLLCVSDATHVTYDSDTMNNVKSIPIEVQLGSLPDLRITSLNVAQAMYSDRAYWVRYTVVNEGERVTQKESWTDAFYIGETMIQEDAFQLGSKIHHGSLAVGATYTDSIEIVLPNSLEGSYYLMGITDVTNQIYEHDNEDDNFLAIPVTVLAPEPSDLIAMQPEFPETIASGEEVEVTWQLCNIGLNSAIGRIRNAVYFSTDAAWSSDDVMLDYVDIDINIATNAQQTCSLSGVLTNVPEGDYYVIVKVNILNALNESSYENNVCVSLMTTEVGYPTLAIGEQVDRSLAADQYIYYKLEVGPEYEGQTLSCTLTSANQQVANGLYLSHEAVPTLAQYDYGQYAPYVQEIEVLIPALEQGNYYLLAKGSTQNGNPQQVSIATSIINFEILHIDADHGSNTGSITTKVTGAKFDSIMDFRLVQSGEYLPAEKVFFSNSTEAYTTFDLVDMPVGTYAMEAELPGGIITIKGNAFVIEEGLPAELAINVVAPASVRFGTTFTVNIEYGNIGTTDLNVSGLVVMSHNGHPIGFTTEALEEGHTELTFDTGEANGNPDVLRPGYRGTKTILVKATPLSDYRLSVYAIRRQY